MDSWFRALSLTFGLQHRKQRRQQQESQAFSAARMEDLGSAIFSLTELSTDLLQRCGPIGLDPEFLDDLKLAPLFAIGEVLSAQGNIDPLQETALKTLLTNTDPVYNYAQFTEAVISRKGVFQDYRRIVGLEETFCGTLWLTLYELMYRTRDTAAFQQLGNDLQQIVLHFALLGDPASPLPQPLCSRILNRMNHHANAYQQTPDIHALLLLQTKLLELRGLSVEGHFLLQEGSAVIGEQGYLIFHVYEKDTLTDCGKFAVKRLRTSGETLDLSDRDEILEQDPDTETYRLFYAE